MADRVSQETVEVVYKTTGAKARVSQEVAEVLYATGAAHAVVSQEAVEVLGHFPSGLGNRVSQVAVEIITTKPFEAVPFIPSVTSVNTPTLVGQVPIPFVGSNTVLYTPSVSAAGVNVPFIGSVTVAYAPALLGSVQPPFISSQTALYSMRLLLGFAGDGVSQVTLELLMPYSTDAHIGGRH